VPHTGVDPRDSEDRRVSDANSQDLTYLTVFAMRPCPNRDDDHSNYEDRAPENNCATRRRATSAIISAPYRRVRRPGSLSAEVTWSAGRSSLRVFAHPTALTIYP